MRIITTKGQFDTETDGVILMFNNDDELSSFISMLVKTPIRTTGIRVLPLIPENVQLTPIQMAILSVIEGLDGLGGNDHDKVRDGATDALNAILSNGS